MSVIHRAAFDKGNAGETSAVTTWQTFVKEWVRHFGRPPRTRAYSAGTYRSKQLRECASGIYWEVGPAEARWMHGRVEGAINFPKVAAARMAMMGP
eukprot:3978627-Pyramimonas_sp.AAC.1